MALVWDAATGTKLFDLPGHTDIVERAVFSRDGRWLATSGYDMTIRVWDMTRTPGEGETPAPQYVLSGHTDRVVGLCFSHDGRRLASTGSDKTIRLWDVDSGNDALTLRGHPDTVCGVAFSPDGRFLVSASTRDIKVWDASDGKAPPISPARAEGDARAWHDQEMRACWFAQPPQWFGARFHFDRLLELQPDDWRLLSGRVIAELELGQWRQAADDATRSIALGATNHSVWFHQAVACLQLSDTDAYRRSCTSMLERFGSENRTGSVRAQAAQANDTAWTCVLAPDAVADLDHVVHLAESAVAAFPGDAGYRNTLGATLYRAGHFEAALKMLRQQQGGPDDWLFLAMVHHRLGHAAEARDWFDKATQWSTEANQGQLAAGAGGKTSMCHRAQIDVLRSEAATLLAITEQMKD